MGDSNKRRVNISDITKSQQKGLNAGPSTTTTTTTTSTKVTPSNTSFLVAQPGNKMNTTRKIHYAFTILYAVSAFLIVAASIIWINFWTTFQSGALGLNVGIAFALFATTIVGKLDRKTLTGEFIVYRKCAIIIGITAVIAAILALFPLYNVINILTKCPGYTTVNIDIKNNNNNNNNPSFLSKTETKIQTLNNNVEAKQQPMIGQIVDLVGNYEFMRDGKKVQNKFYLVYDIKHQMLTQKQKIGLNRWIQVETNTIESTTFSTLLRELNELPVSVKNNMSKYYFLEQEIQRLIGESNYNLVNIHDGIGADSNENNNDLEKNTFKTTESAYANPDGNKAKATTNPLYLELMAQEICLYEYAFAILWTIFIIFLILLNIATVPAYAWIKSIAT